MIHNKEKRVYIAGSEGMVGSAVTRELEKREYRDLIIPPSRDLDLVDQAAVERFFETQEPEVVILAAAKVGGILANDTRRAEFLYDNLMIEANVINAAHRVGVEKLIFLGSSCIYPRLAEQPIKEEALLTAPLESTNEPYAIAKIAGVKLCESYFRQYGANFYSAMPTNLYGPNDNFDLDSSHVIPALIRKFHAGKVDRLESVTVWGTGKPLREFMFVDDLADAIAFLLENIEARDIYDDGVSHVNIGVGKDIEIGDLAPLIARIVGFEGEIIFDTNKPDGTPRKLLDTSRLFRMGWSHTTPLEKGLRATYDWFLRSGHIA